MDAYHKNSKVPHIQILDIAEDVDDKPNISFEVNDAFLSMIKKEKNIENVTQEELSEYVYELMKNCSNKTDGYDYEKITEEQE
tara:strand:+ start:85 stop:333 length:249 start_codon:yes stop_codon:yes gene_type:complete